MSTVRRVRCTEFANKKSFYKDFPPGLNDGEVALNIVQETCEITIIKLPNTQMAHVQQQKSVKGFFVFH